MSNNFASPFDLPEDLQQLESSLATLQPAGVQSTSAEMLFASGLSAGVKQTKANQSTVNNRSRWQVASFPSFVAGTVAGMASAAIALKLLFAPVASGVDSQAATTAKVNAHPVQAINNSIAGATVQRETDWAKASDGIDSAPGRSELDRELSPVIQKIWNRIDRQSIGNESTETAVGAVTFNYLTVYELRKLAAETL